MCLRYAFYLAFVLVLCGVPSDTNEVTKAIQRMEKGLQGLKDYFLAKKVLNNYVGCYMDTGDRILKGYKLKGDSTMTIEKCIGLCKVRDFKHAGVEFAQECFCGNEFKSERRPENECNMPCKGNKAQMCGGIWRIGVYPI